jgi:Tfp pilus assembly protein PilO
MGPNWPLDWGLVVELVFPLLLGVLVFVIGIQLLLSVWHDKAAGPRFPDEPGGV